MKTFQALNLCASNGMTDSMDMSLSRLRQFVMDREARRAIVIDCTVRHDCVTELNGMTFIYNSPILLFYTSMILIKVFKLLPPETVLKNVVMWEV